MKLKLIALLALSVVICLSSCKKDDDPTPPPVPEGEGKGIVLRLDLPGRPSSRASIEGPITSTIVPGLNLVEVYLYDQQSGIIYYSRSLNATELATAAGVGGLQLTNLHPNINAITIICNNTQDKGLSVSINDQIADLFAKPLLIQHEQEFNNLTYIGSDIDLVEAGTPAGGSADIDYFSAEVTVVPLVARIEVSEIQTSATSSGLITFDNLYIRSVFTEDVLSTGVRLDYLTNVAAHSPDPLLITTEAQAEGLTGDWWLEVLEAPNLNAQLGTTAWSPAYDATTGVFAFHIFANGSVPTVGLYVGAERTPLPTFAQYVRFNDFRNAGGVIDEFLTGHIYKVKPLFEGEDVKNFDDDPREITLSITVQEWTIHDNIIAGDGSLSWVDINMGTEASPNWIKVADRNAQLGTPNGATSGAGATDYGSHMQFSNGSNNTSDPIKAYQACYNFGEGGGVWRLPTLAEMEAIIGEEINTTNDFRKINWNGTEWRLYDERDPGQTTNYVIFPMSGFTLDNSGVQLEGTTGEYWTGTGSGGTDAWWYNFNNTGTSEVGVRADGYGFSVRCVRDA